MAPRFAAAALLLGLAGSATAGPDPDLPEPVKRAIKGGQGYLHQVYRPGGPGPGAGGGGRFPVMPPMPGFAIDIDPSHGIGPAALAGLALLESGAPVTDAAVANITRACRAAAFSSEGTYQVSLLIMFFDRLGRKSDRLIIQFLTLRLLTGQLPDGTWSYSCDGLRLDPVQQAQLEAELGREAKLQTPDTPGESSRKGGRREDLDDTPKPKKDEPKPEEKEPDRIHPALERVLRQLPAAPGGGIGGVGGGDHSNTQFATVGLWIGRRHSVDVSAALGKIDQHYRACQAADGGWSYTQAAGGGSSAPAMTCAGLMGLAIGFGAKNLPSGKDAAPRVDPDALNKDPAVTAGLKYLGAIVAAGRQPDAGTGFQPLAADLYFLWSLERVGMVYGLKSIGNVDWYEWGSRFLVATQNQRDGSWAPSGHASTPDVSTAFALLFLGRANLTEDLSNKLKGKVQDPGTSRLIRTKDLDAVLEGAAKASAGSRGSAGSKRADSGAAAKQPRTDTPAATADPAAKLAKALVEAGPGERAGLIEKYRETRGGEYTDALARAAGQLTGEAQVLVRDALAQRLTRMKPTTLVELMRDSDRELRRAAALACGPKGKERLPEFADALIRLVADEDAMVAQAARASLKTLTDQDFGPEVGAAAKDRVNALTAWRKWWDERKK